jgi:hypothetical protein
MKQQISPSKEATGTPHFPDAHMPPSESEAEDKAITVRISHELYSMQRGKWNHPKELPFWRREKKK